MTAPAIDSNGHDQPLPAGICADGLREPVRGLLRRLAEGVGVADPPCRLLGLTGPSGGEGVSTVAARLAAEAAMTRHEPVLLVDAHLARPAVHRLLEVQSGPGLAEALREGRPLEEVLQTTALPTLYALAAGRGAADLATAGDTAQLRELFHVLRGEFALTVLDLPPAPRLHHPAGLVGLLDGLVFVVEAEQTPWETVRREKECLEGQARLAGVVLNKRPRHTPEWLDRFL